MRMRRKMCIRKVKVRDGCSLAVQTSLAYAHRAPRHKTVQSWVLRLLYIYRSRVVLTLTLTYMQATVMLLHAVLCAQIKPTFHKINVHAAMTPSDIQKHFKLVFDQARELSHAFKKSQERVHKKASLDEITVSVDTGKKWSLKRKTSRATRAPAEGHSGEENVLYRMPFVTVSHVAHNFCLFQ